jgi:membrane fusion protein (multidrug efflux system)
MMQPEQRLPLGACFVSFALALRSGSRARREPAAVAVGTVYAERKPIAKTADFFVGASSDQPVEIRARVKGYLEGCSSKGDLVKKVSPHRIEKGSLRAAVDKGGRRFGAREGGLTLAGLQRKRAEELLAKAAGTVVARDQAVAEEDQAKGTFMTLKRTYAPPKSISATPTS